MDDDTPIDKALNIQAATPYSSVMDLIVSSARNDSASEDFTYARANIREVIAKGAEAIETLAQIAEQSQDSESYEVLARMMDSIVNASEKLLKLQKSIRDIDKIDIPRDEAANKIINNNLFVGSTTDLQKLISDMKQ